jgi:hypothetical protein
MELCLQSTHSGTDDDGERASGGDGGKGTVGRSHASAEGRAVQCVAHNAKTAPLITRPPPHCCIFSSPPRCCRRVAESSGDTNGDTCRPGFFSCYCASACIELQGPTAEEQRAREEWRTD